MRTVGVRELKAHLSRVLREVQRGERVLVTDRGRVIAELRQPLAPDPVEMSRADVATRLAATGQVRVGEPRPDAYGESPLRARAGLAQEMLDEDRNERTGPR